MILQTTTQTTPLAPTQTTPLAQHKPLLWPHTNCSSGTTQTTPLTLPLISKHMTTEAVGISDWLNSGDHGL
jgi:hypothetical protein